MGPPEEKQKKRMGRPMKYRALLRSLNSKELYSAGAIARFARDTGYLARDCAGVEPRLAMLRIRITMGRLSKNHNFPLGGDGLIALERQMSCPAWFGWRWQQTCPESEP